MSRDWRTIGLLGAGLLWAAAVAVWPQAGPARSRGVEVEFFEHEAPGAQSLGRQELYRSSYALVIGIDDYSAGWPDLDNAIADAEAVANTLESVGFEVERARNLDADALRATIRRFFSRRGQDPDARLLLWYAGHGATLGNEGYLVASNAPAVTDRAGFLERSVHMREFGSFVRLARAKHVLAIFDACFAGTIFTARDGAAPRAITRITGRPVRQFITSGGPDQRVRDDGSFRILFERAVTGTERADVNGDGYVTGAELGLYLSQRMSALTNDAQTPKYGKLQDVAYDQGDFVFALPRRGPEPVRVGAPVARLDRWRKLEPATWYRLPVLDNDRAAAGGRLSVTAVGVPRRGRARVADDGGSVLYAANAGSGGNDRFTYTVSEEAGGQAEGVVELELTERAAPPPPPSAEEVEQALSLTAADWRKFQEVLNRLGYRAGPADGVPGAVTRGAVERWQRTAECDVIEYGYLTASCRAALLEAEVPGPWRDPVTGMEFVWVPGGAYQMGCGSWTSDCDGREKPVHRVTLDGFWLGKYEVTQGEWRRVMGNNPSRFKSGDNHPVEQVSWNDVQDFIRRLNSQSSATFRLPSEAEWEYACRSGGREEKYSGGGDLGSVAWYRGNSGRRTHPVGTKAANGLGLHDMSGNVWEWVQDWYASDAYRRHSERNPIYEAGGSYRVNRGGSWNHNARYVRCAFRGYLDPGIRQYNLGLRLLRTLTF